MELTPNEITSKLLVVSSPSTTKNEEKSDPRALSCLKFIKPLEDENFREKCGEIYVENGKYSLICRFCHEDHENLEIFIEHMVEHLIPKSESLNSDASSDSESEEEDIKDVKPILNVKSFKNEYNNHFYNERKVLQKLKIYEDDEDDVATPASISAHNNFLGNNYKNENGVYNNNYNDDMDGNRIECIPDIGMFFSENSEDNTNDQTVGNGITKIKMEPLPQSIVSWNGAPHYRNELENDRSNWNKATDGRYHCHMCDKSYQYSKSLKEHVDLIHKCKEKTFKCSTCDKAFSKQWKLNTHLKVHTDERPYICNICVMTFKWKKNLSRHLMRVHQLKLSDIKPEEYNLNLINSQTTTTTSASLKDDDPETFNEHLFKNSSFNNSIEHGNDLNDYPIIKNLLTDNNTIINQRNSPLNKLISKVHTQKSMVSTSSNFPILNHSIKKEKLDEDEHQNSQFSLTVSTSGITPIPNPITSSRITAVSYNSTKGNDNTRNTNTSTPNQNQMINNDDNSSNISIPFIKSEPNFGDGDEEQGEITDSHMSYKFTNFVKNSVYNGSNNEGNESPGPTNDLIKPEGPLVPNKDGFYSCRVCSKVYLRKDSLRAHERIHSAGLSCRYCGKSFSHRYFLDRHVRTHTGEKPFRCHLCNASFVEENTLRNHIKFHIGDKRFACSFCSKRFIKQYEKIEHERNAHNNQIPPYRCNFCNKVFNQIKTLRYHKKICIMNTHPEQQEQIPQKEEKQEQLEEEQKPEEQEDIAENENSPDDSPEESFSEKNESDEQNELENNNLEEQNSQQQIQTPLSQPQHQNTQPQHQNPQPQHQNPQPQLQQPPMPPLHQPQLHQPQLHQPQLHQPQLHQPQLHQPQLHQPQLHQPQLHQPQLHQPQLLQSQQNQQLHHPQLVQTQQHHTQQLQPHLHQSQLHQSQLHQSQLHTPLHQPQMHQSQLHQPQLHQPQLHQPQLHQPQLHQSQILQSQLHQPQLQLHQQQLHQSHHPQQLFHPQQHPQHHLQHLAATHPSLHQQQYYPQQYVPQQIHPQHPQQYDPQSHLTNQQHHQMAYIESGQF